DRRIDPPQRPLARGRRQAHVDQRDPQADPGGRMVSAISPAAFHRALGAGGVEFFCGVPDSLLKEFCSYIDAAAPAGSHVIAVNEGAAVAMAAGHHLATGKVPLVYMQNSGLGNAVNPLLSLADPEV